MTTDDTIRHLDTETESRLTTDRRRFLRAAGAGAAGLAGPSGVAGARIEGDTVIELEAVTVEDDAGRGRSEYAWADDGAGIVRGSTAALCNPSGGNHAWTGVAPDDVADRVNPTLSLTAGETYTLEWTNADGDEHDLVVVDGDGNELQSTAGSSTEGESRSIEFEASEDMAAYYCATHSQSQRGTIEVGTNESPDPDRIAADPTDVPDPIDRPEPATVEVDLEATEVLAEVEPGVTFRYMTFDGQVPGPMIRVRQGDTVEVTLTNSEDSVLAHNVDFHAVRGPGGGAEASLVAPGETETFRFEATYPGAFIYHCAVPQLDYHISSGMYGLILVEPEEGLPDVDHEFYFGQNELYTTGDAGQAGHHDFDFEAMAAEEPTYVLMNGEKYAITGDGYGPATVDLGDTARVYFVTGGPNLTSSFHPIGCVWDEVWPQGGIGSDPHRNIQTTPVMPGSCTIATMHFEVPGPVKLVDHALSRVARKGFMAVIAAEGDARPEIFDPDP